MKDRLMTLGVGAAAAMSVVTLISFYTTAGAQTAVPPAGPRGIAAPQELQRPAPQPFQQQFAGGGGSIAADQGMVFVMRGNMVFVLTRDPQTGRFRVSYQVELPGGRPNPSGQNPFRPQTRPGGPPPPKG